MNLDIKPTQIEDLNAACDIFKEAIAFQKANGLPQYRNDARDTQEAAIKNKEHFKVVIDDEIAAIFMLLRRDELIWREMNDDTSLIMHGIITRSKFKGQKLFGKIIDWSKSYAKSIGVEKLRLDTWYPNPTLISYYQSFGFECVEIFQTPDNPNVHENFRGNKVILLELKIK